MAHVSEYDVENLFIDRLESIGYQFIEMANYDDVLANFREQLTKFNARKLVEAERRGSIVRRGVRARDDSHGRQERL
ncbi:MAG: hypothetical protein ACLRL4_01445 [Bifidobacterium bifidum]